MNNSDPLPTAKHSHTKYEKNRLSTTRAKDDEVEEAAKKLISKHRNAIKELARR